MRLWLSDLLEAIGVLGVGFVLWVEVGWPWALLPVFLYLIIFGATLGRGRP